jgi:hypothetical protein
LLQSPPARTAQKTPLPLLHVLSLHNILFFWVLWVNKGVMGQNSPQALWCSLASTIQPMSYIHLSSEASMPFGVAVQSDSV